jgi:hypothetical protein
MELHRYRLRPDAKPADFWEADGELQEAWYYQQPGIGRRITCSSDDGWWVSMVWWTGEPPVDQTCPLLFFGATAALVDATTLTTERYSPRLN